MQHALLCFLICFSFLSCSSKDGKIGAEKIEASVKSGEDIVYEGTTIKGDLHLIDQSAASMASPFLGTQCLRSSLVFKNCTFTGKVIASLKENGKGSYVAVFSKNIYFDNCIFEDDLNMEGAMVYGFCNFLNCTFKKEALFNRVQFYQNAAFTKCDFQKTAGFQFCTFMNSAFFNDAHFEAEAFFQSSYAYRDFTFSVTVCDGYTDFTSFNCYSNFFFNYAKCAKAVVFSGSNMRGKLEFVGSQYATCELESCMFYGPALFDKSTFSKKLDLKGTKFLAGKPSTNGYKAETIDLTDVEVTGFNKLGEF